MTELDNFSFKMRAIEEEWKIHFKTYRVVNVVFTKYAQIERNRVEQLKQLLPELDSINFLFYKHITTRLANYIDTNVYQCQHMLEDFQQTIENYKKRFIATEKSFTQLLREFKRRRFDVTDSISQLHKSISTNVPKPQPRNQIDNYNYCLQKYGEANKNILQFRKVYHQQLIGLAEDQITRFFVFELERLRNNQFDIDEILKKPKKVSETIGLVDLKENVEWSQISSGNLTSKLSSSLEIEAFDKIVQNIFKEKIPENSSILNLFNAQSIDENIGKIRSHLEESQDYEDNLKKLLSSFRDQENRTVLEGKAYKKVEEIGRIALEYSIQNLKVELLESCLGFLNAIKTEKFICKENDVSIYDLVSLMEELKNHDYFKQEYWISFMDYIAKNNEGEEKEHKLQKYRRCMRKMGISISEQLKPKKRIFTKVQAANTNSNKPEKIQQKQKSDEL